MGKTAPIIVVALAGLALAFRLPYLSVRPMHSDEANQAVKTGILLETGRYRYDPEDHHGPTLYYLSLPLAWATAGRDFAATTEVTFRLVTVAFGLGLVLLPLLMADGLGRWGAAWAGVLMAVSPAMVYYSRFYVHEMLLAFFTLAAVAAGWRWARTRRLGWAVAAGACVGLMQATKETSVIAYAAAAGAVALTIVTRRKDGDPADPLPVGHLLWAAVAAMLVWAVWLSSFFTNPRGPLDAVLAYGGYLRRAGGAGLHEHPWHFYLHMLTWWRPAAGGPVWGEAPLVALAAAGVVAGFIPRCVRKDEAPLVRFIAFYTVILLAIYSLIPYKTPWCLVSPVAGLCLLGGVGIVGVARLLGRGRGAVLGAALAAGAVLLLGGQACRASFRLYAHPTNPYAYSQTSTDLLGLIDRVEGAAAVHPAGGDMLVRVVAPPHETWPLPWYFRALRRVGYWISVGDLPSPADAPVIVTVPEFQDEIRTVLTDDYRIAYYGLRNEVLLALYVRSDLWQAMFPSQTESAP